MRGFGGSYQTNRKSRIDRARGTAAHNPIGDKALMERMVTYIKEETARLQPPQRRIAITNLPCPAQPEWEKLAYGNSARLPSIMSLKLYFASSFEPQHATTQEFLEAIFELARERTLSTFEPQ